ncbi:MAG: enolase C-terminal domain-like protein [Gemmatimonadales bacterium]|nr:enolase C-terminal domain-like protein [Gemmatimonadales bacterium]
MDPLDTPLEITGARLFEVAIPLTEPFRISGGAMSTRRSLIVELTDASGAVGYGESAPFERPFYSGETLYSAKACHIQHLFPKIKGQTFGSLDVAVHSLEKGIRDNRMARAGIETAMWDLVCAKTGVSLRTLLAACMQRLGVPDAMRASRPYVESGAALGIPEDDDLEDLGEQAQLALEAGYKRIKVKVEPGFDVAPVKAVHDAAHKIGRKVRIWADANGSYSREKDMEALQALDREGLVLLEQPLSPDDVLGTIKLAHEIVTPVCVDESLVDDRAAQLMLESDGPKVWNLKIQRVGGLWEGVKIYQRAVEGGVKLWGGTMPETGVGAHAILCLGAFAGFVYPTDVAPSKRWYEPGADLIEMHMDGQGRISVSDTPGLHRFKIKEKLEKVGRVVG